MLNFFYIKDPIAYPTQIDASIDYVRRIVKRDILSVKSYIQNRNSRVSNTNILAKIIDTLNIDYKLDIFTYLSILDSRAKIVSKHFKICSDIDTGTIHFNNIYPDSKEIFIYTNNTTNITDRENDWDSITPLTVIKHSNTDLRYSLPDFHTPTYIASPLYVYQLDIYGLLVQYKYWALHRLNTNQSTDPVYYIYQYVYSNMIDSYTNISVFNRVISMVDNININDPINPYPFTLSDISRRTDKLLTYAIKKIKNKHRYVEILQHIPSITDDTTLYDKLMLSITLLTRNNKYVYYLARLEYIYYLIILAGERGYRINNMYNSILRIALKELNNNNYLSNYQSILDSDISYYIEEISETIGDYK